MSDDRPDKRRTVVDELLVRSRYADYWGFRLRQWITDLREVKGQGANTYTLYRYTREAMAENRTWDRIADDLLDSQGNLVYDGNANFGVYLSGEPNEMAEGASRLFLGEKISCAQCHDDPFQETWTRKGYWSMAAFFARTKMIQMNEGGPKFNSLFPNPGRSEASVPTLPGGDAAVDGDDGEKRAITDVTRGDMYLGGKKTKNGPILLPAPFQGEPIGHIDKDNRTRRQQFVDWITGRDNKQFARAAVNRWFLELTGRGFVATADGFTPDGDVLHAPLLDQVADKFAEQGYDVKWLVRTIVHSRLFQLAPGSAHDNGAVKHWQCSAVRKLNSDQWHDSIIRASGREERIGALAGTATPILDLERSQRMTARVASLTSAKKVLTDGGEVRRAAALPDAKTATVAKKVELSDESRRRAEKSRREYGELGARLRRTRQLARGHLGPTGDALMQMNGRLVTESLRETDVPASIAALKSADERLDAVFFQVLGRPPAPEERKRLAPAVADPVPQRVVDLMWSLMQTSEFLTN
jgi:hypothetical protein